MIEALLKDKTVKEKANLKSKELAKVKLGKFSKDGFDIEIVGDVKTIKDGIEVFAKAKGLGFGKDGSVEIERFRFFNPPVLVDDPAGDIIKVSKDKQRTLKYDPEEAIRQILLQTIKIVGKKGTEVIKGKIGNTTSTFFPDAGSGSTTVDGFITSDRSGSSWNVVHDDTTGTEVNTGGDNENNVNVFVDGTRFAIRRAYLYFDTSALGGSDTIDSATFSVYVNSAVGGDNDGDQFISVVQVQGNNIVADNNLATSDFDLCGSAIDDPVEGIATGTRKLLNSGFTTSAYNDFVLNATGEGWVAKDGEAKPSGATNGITYLGLREGHDILDNPIVDGSNHRLAYNNADHTGTTQDPKLVIEHTAAVITFSVSDTISIGEAHTEDMDIAVNNSISISENITISKVISFIVQDTINIAESFIGNISIKVSSAISIAENIITTIKLPWINRTKPTTSYSIRSKPTTSYSNRSKPTTSWTKRND